MGGEILERSNSRISARFEMCGGTLLLRGEVMIYVDEWGDYDSVRR